MKYTSTRHNSPQTTFVDALWHPNAPDGGLYMPESIPVLPKAVLANMADMSMAEIGYVVFKAAIGDEFSSAEIKDIVERAYNFNAPMVDLSDNATVIELFEGPTLAFKDFGARATARLLEATAATVTDGKLNVLIATTGNTGSAMANALAGAKNINVFIVFPRGTATRALENQFTTPGRNIIPVEVSGSIDACQTLVATAIGDKELNDRLIMLSGNSGNIARLLGQTVYYFYAVSRMLAKAGSHGKSIAVAVPCGNLGNLTAGVLAKKMGLEIGRFIACENSNDYLTRALLDEDFAPRPAIPTLAYAADKSVPTNIERILDLYGDNIEQLEKDVTPVSVKDADIIEAINECKAEHNYLLDPHSAMAYYGLHHRLRGDESGLILATAHPAKSLTAMSAITGRPIEMPLQLNRFMGRQDHRIRIKPIYSSLKQIIKEANGI